MQLQLRWLLGQEVALGPGSASQVPIIGIHQFIPRVTLSGLIIRSPGITPDNDGYRANMGGDRFVRRRETKDRFRSVISQRNYYARNFTKEQ